MNAVPSMLSGPAVTAVPWRPLAGALALGVALLGVVATAADPLDALRWGAVVLAVGIAGVFDDPSAELRASLPVSDRRVRLAALGLVAPVLAVSGLLLASVATASWLLGDGRARSVGACIALVRGPLVLESVAVVAVVLAVAALGRRLGGGTGGAISGVAAGMLLYVVVQLLPGRLALAVGPLDPRWPGSRLRWLLLLVLAAGLVVVALADRWRRRRARRPVAAVAVAVLTLLALIGTSRPVPDVDAAFRQLVEQQGLVAVDAVTDAGGLRHGPDPGPVAVLDVVVVGTDRVVRSQLTVAGGATASDLRRWATGLPAAGDDRALWMAVAADLPPGLRLRAPEAPTAGTAVAEVVVDRSAGTIAAVAVPGEATCGVAVASTLHAVG